MTRNSFKKEDFSKEVNDKIGLSFNLSKKIIDDLLIVLSEHIKNNKLILKNIGSFKILNKSERVGRNPKTGEDFVIKKKIGKFYRFRKFD